MSRWNRISSSLAGAIVLIPLLTGCSGAPIVSCSGSAHNVHRSSGTPTAMVGKVTGSCSAPVSVNGFVEI